MKANRLRKFLLVVLVATGCVHSNVPPAVADTGADSRSRLASGEPQALGPAPGDKMVAQLSPRPASPSAAASDDEVVVTVTGTGLSVDLARQNAYRNAVEQGLGVLIDSNTLVKNAQVIEDRVLSRAQGFVKDAQQIGPVRDAGGGLKEIRIQATVKKAILKDELTAIGILSSQMGNPRLLVAPNPKCTAAAGVKNEVYGGIVEVLADKGFEVVDKATGDAFAQEQRDVLAEKVASAAAEYGLRYNAEYVVLYDGEDLGLQQGQVFGIRRVRGSAEVINTTNARILGDKAAVGDTRVAIPDYGKGGGLAPAARKCGNELINALLVPTLADWGRRVNLGQTIVLVLEGIGDDYEHLMLFKTELKKIDGVSEVDKRESGGGKASFDLKYKGKPADLEDGIFLAMQAVGWKLRLIRSEGNRMIWSR